MKKYCILLAFVLLSFIFIDKHAFAQQKKVEDKNNRPRESQVITSDQKTSAKKILSKYTAKTLTSEDAKDIHKAMRDIGIFGGPAEDELIKSLGVDPEVLKKLDPPPDKPVQNKSDNKDLKKNESKKRNSDEVNNKYNIDQAISDNAQLHTIAFSGLAFLTGDFGAATFIPPGKVCDFFGFQYMRDIDAAEKGHNPIFLNRVAGNIFYILNKEQLQVFLDLAEEQAVQLKALAKMRLPLIKAFYIERDNQIPKGSTGLNKKSVMQSVGEIFALDAKLSLRRAEAMAKVALSLTPDQKAYLAKMKFGDFNTWPSLDEKDKIMLNGRGKSKMFNVAYMTYASEFFSWTAGSEEADTYFCPERHGTYFGGFYMKDMPAMGKRDYDISTSATGDNGKAFLNDVLNTDQRKQIEATLDLQRKALAEIITVRRAISIELRKYLNGQPADEKKIILLGRRYGELDGEVSWYYATAFARVNRTLTAKQRAELVKLYNLEGYESAPYYIYSEAIRTKPELDNIDAFFYPPQKEK